MSYLIAHARKLGADVTPIGPFLRYRSGVVACLPSGSVFVDDGDVQVVRGACTPHRSPEMDQAPHQGRDAPRVGRRRQPAQRTSQAKSGIATRSPPFIADSWAQMPAIVQLARWRRRAAAGGPRRCA